MVDKDQLVKQYEPLVNKIVNQFCDQNFKFLYKDIKSMAYEGLALAINKYDSERSTMSFMQYAAYAIRNNILTGLNNELRTVKLSAYAQNKAKENGEVTYNTVSIDRMSFDSEDDDIHPREKTLNMYEDEKFSNGNIFEYLYSRLEDEFNVRDCMIFYKVFGLKNYDEMKSKDIAKELNISEGLVSQRLKKMVYFIKHDKDLCEVLSSLL